MRSPRRTIGCLVAFMLLIVGSPAAAHRIRPDALTHETLKISDEPDELTTVWWIPEEFWFARFGHTPDVRTAEEERFLQVVRPYTIVVVVEGTVGPAGEIAYQSEDYVRAHTRLVDAQGQSYAPQTEEEMDPAMRSLLQILRPMVAHNLGPMGQNIHFLVFPGRTDAGARIADAQGKGQFKLVVGDTEFLWRLPLDSVMPGKVCAGCHQEGKNSWNFCPECGTRLVRQ